MRQGCGEWITRLGDFFYAFVNLRISEKWVAGIDIHSMGQLPRRRVVQSISSNYQMYSLGS